MSLFISRDAKQSCEVAKRRRALHRRLILHLAQIQARHHLQIPQGQFFFDFPMVFPWFSKGFPRVFLGFSHFPMDFPMVSLWLCQSQQDLHNILPQPGPGRWLALGLLPRAGQVSPWAGLQMLQMLMHTDINSYQYIKYTYISIVYVFIYV